jgi:hypothetical protein
MATEIDTEEQLSLASYAAEQWAARLRPLYESWPTHPAPEQHWDLLIQVALGPDEKLPDLVRMRTCRMVLPTSAPGGCSLSG